MLIELALIILKLPVFAKSVFVDWVSDVIVLTASVDMKPWIANKVLVVNKLLTISVLMIDEVADNVLAYIMFVCIICAVTVLAGTTVMELTEKELT